MITNLNQLDMTKRYTYADYLTWQFTDRVELIKGWIKKMSPAPTRLHQKVSMVISNVFYNYLTNMPCSVYVAPFDVRFVNTSKSTSDKTIYTVVQPDICVICDVSKLDEKGCIGAPDLIVEIVSKGNTKHELETKFELYQEAGVKEYWIVGQGDETVSVFELKKGKYVLRKIYSNDSLVPVGIFKNLSIDMKSVFE